MEIRNYAHARLTQIWRNGVETMECFRDFTNFAGSGDNPPARGQR
jgi:hypothetical protein